MITLDWWLCIDTEDGSAWGGGASTADEAMRLGLRHVLSVFDSDPTAADADPEDVEGWEASKAALVPVRFTIQAPDPRGVGVGLMFLRGDTPSTRTTAEAIADVARRLSLPEP